MNEHRQFENLLKNLGVFFHYKIYRLRNWKMDPITAALNFLTTPVGQKYAEDLRNLNQGIIKIIAGFFQHIHDKNVAPTNSLAATTSVVNGPVTTK